ncbi:90574dcb-a5f3-475c-bbb6-a7a0a9634f2a [Thermothielavioides terrestris]
MYYY